MISYNISGLIGTLGFLCMIGQADLLEQFYLYRWTPVPYSMNEPLLRYQLSVCLNPVTGLSAVSAWKVEKYNGSGQHR